jgi:inorganic pyrophosphatase
MQPDPSPDFWCALDQLVASSAVVIDWPKGSRRPHWPDRPYPLDYGHLEATRAGDGREIDVWIGEHSSGLVTACGVTVDLYKRDSEIKILIDCGPEEIEAVKAFHDFGPMHMAVFYR